MPDLRVPPIPTSLRYGVVAGCCLLLHNAIMILADWSGLQLWQAASLSFGTMIVIGYVLLSAFVFDQPRSWTGFFRYSGAMAANFPLSTGLVWLFYGPFGAPMTVAAPAATLAMVLVNYLGSRWAISGRAFGGGPA
ncbi:GtrA family protein [Sphingomonas psychrotolerans]|uniref:GtrA family protein n=1 Tax=Sphingomonas psychrotolerans TaxID=1327635 RepID=A0ABU3MYK5_9SPHN|nr:GtrA family protein [Sphingomonas psychrotolerans]MDT8757308.1 GtrA family protein [Sphingomonas psychrotolerans]